MSFIPTSTTTLLSSFTQLTQPSAESTVSGSLTRIAVSQLLNNQVSLATTRQTFTLPTERLTGKLETGKNYSANIETTSAGTRLNFFPPDVSAPQLLARPASESIIAQLPTLLSQQQIDDVLELQARTINVTQQRVALNVNGKEIIFDLANANQRFRVNQNVQLTLKASPEGWLVALQPEGQSHSTTPPSTLVRISPAQALTLLSTNPTKPFQVLDKQLNLSQLQTGSSKTNSTSQANPAVIAHQGTALPNSSALLSASSSTLLSLTINSSGLVQLTPAPTLLASLPVHEKDIALLTQSGLKQVARPLSEHSVSQSSLQDTVTLRSQPEKIDKTLTSQTQQPHHTQATTKTEQIVTTDTARPSQPRTQVTLPAQLQQQIVSLIRQSQPIQDSPSQSFTRLINLLDDPLIANDSNLLSEIKRIRNQLLSTSVNAENSTIDQSVRQIVSSPPLPLTTQQLTAPPSNNHFLSGIISLLQLSLSAKLAQTQPASLERLVQALGPVLSAPISGSVSSNQPKTSLAKRLSDWLQLEQKHQGLNEINKLLASHQNSKLAGIEQQAQGMEVMYYVLPISMGDARRDAEILIKREPENAQEQNNSKQTRAWQLTMKLDIGEKGQLLSKAHLKENELELDFYASNQHLVNEVLNFLPYLKLRFEHLGILVSKRSCQLGKIPDHLYQRPYHILETRV